MKIEDKPITFTCTYQISNTYKMLLRVYGFLTIILNTRQYTNLSAFGVKILNQNLKFC